MSFYIQTPAVGDKGRQCDQPKVADRLKVNGSLLGWPSDAQGRRFWRRQDHKTGHLGKSVVTSSGRQTGRWPRDDHQWLGWKARGGGRPMGAGEGCSCRGSESSWQNVLNGGGRGTRRVSPARPIPSLTATPSPSDGSE